MTNKRGLTNFFILFVLATLAACGGGSSAPPADTTTPPASVTALIGAAGGTVTGPDGVQVVIPDGALDQPTTIGIARDGRGAPELGGLRLISPVYAITPHGTVFAESARISIPYNPADVAPGTQPIIIKSQPGGSWTSLISDVTGNSMAADTSGLSYYAVGTCYTSRDVTVGGPDPLLYCPANHSLQLRLQDGSGVSLPVPRNALGTQLPAMTISTLTTLNFNAEYNRPAGIDRNDLLSVWVFGAGLLPSQQPLTDFVVNQTPIPPTWVVIDPATVPLAGRPGGVVIRINAWVEYTTDAFYPGCLCFKPASWTFEAEVPVRVIYTAPPVVTHTIGGTVSGLTGTGLVLRNNGGDNRAVTADGAFTFATAIGDGAPYSVTLLTQPSGQTCTVQNGSGTANATVTNVAVSCVATPNPVAWGTAAVIETNAGNAYAPQIAIDTNGNALAVWQQHDGTRDNLVANRYTAGSGWGTASLIETDNAGNASSPQIAIDANGNALAVWNQFDGTRYNIWANRFIAGTGAGTGWGTATLIETDNAGNAYFPQIAIDTNGNALAVWTQSDGTRYNIVANRYTAGTGWGTASPIETDNAGDASSLAQIAIDNNGNALAVWYQHDGARTNIWANRFISGTGAGTGWGTASLIETDNTGDAYYPQIAIDTNGNALAVWHQFDGTRNNIWANRYQ